jgi:uncharacterized protein (TIGR00266 family)
MEIEILFRPSYSLGVIKLAPDEQVRLIPGRWSACRQGSASRPKPPRLKSLTRCPGWESFFQNFSAPATGGEITVAPDLPGDVFMVELTGEKMMVQSGSFLACEMGIELDTKVSLKGFMSAEGFSMLTAAGSGKLLLSSYGAIFEKTLAAGEVYTVDTTHLVAFNANMTVTPRAVGGLKSTLLSGEGLVVELTGPGRLLMQTRSPNAFLSWLIPHLPFKRQGSGLNNSVRARV